MGRRVETRYSTGVWGSAQEQWTRRYVYDGWQTKWDLDIGTETSSQFSWGLYDYGLRFYQPEHGSFINRDPIREAGGLNLYEAFGGDPVNNWDLLGLLSPDETGGTYERAIDQPSFPATELPFIYTQVGSGDYHSMSMSTIQAMGMRSRILSARNFSSVGRMHETMPYYTRWNARGTAAQKSTDNKATQGEHIYRENNPIELDPFVVESPMWAQGRQSWSFYRWLYTGDGRAPDSVYQDALRTVANFWVEAGALRGISVGGSLDVGGEMLGIRGSIGGAADVDNGISGNAAIGGRVKAGDVTGVAGYGIQYSENGGLQSSTGASVTFDGARISSGIIDGATGNLNLGFRYKVGKYGSLHVGFIVDPARARQNLIDRWRALIGGGDG